MSDHLIFDPATGELVASSRQAMPRKAAAVPRTPLARPVRTTPRVQGLAPELRHEDVEVRRAAVAKFAAGRGEWDAPTLQALIELLDDADAPLADAALEAAAAHGFHAAMAPPLQALLRRGSRQGLLRLLALLRRHGPQAAALADDVVLLLEHSADDIASAARDALGSTGLSPRAAAEITSMIRHRDPAPRLRCVQLLGLLGARAAKAAGLVVLRMDDPEPQIRDAARASLVQIGFQEAALGEMGRMLNHARTGRRLEMLELLAGYGSSAQPAASLVVDQLRSDSAEVRDAAARSLGIIGIDASCLRPIHQLAHHPSHEMRATALELLEACTPGPDCADLLLSLMADRDVGVRDRAAAAFSRYDLTPPMLPPLRRLLRDERWEVRMGTLGALERAGPRARPALRLVVERIEDAHADVAKSAVIAFRSIGFADFCLPDVERLLNHRRQDKRLMTLQALQRFGEGAANALPLVTRRLGDEDWVVREAACEAFIAIGFHEACLPDVRRLIQHQDREFRLAVIRALGACGLSAGAAADFLEARRLDNDAEVGRAAQRALLAVRGG